MFTQDEVARRAYEKAEKFRRDQRAMFSFTKRETAKDIAASLLTLGKLTIDEIAAASRLTPDEVRALAAR